MKTILKILSLSLLLCQPLLAQHDVSSGGESGGGGDDSEARVNEIRSDLLKWISEGGAKNLALPPGLTLKEYEQKMKVILQPKKVVVIFVENDHSQDEELRVSVNGQPKTCRGFISRKNNLPYILCNIERFSKTSESGQYRLIHHEYAGLQRLERNDGAASDYEISNQLTDFLVQTSVLRLAVAGAKPDLNRPCGLSGSIADRIKNCHYVNFNWQLVSRTKDLIEVWLDPNGLIWSDLLETPNNGFDIFLPQNEAQKACHSGLQETAMIPGQWQLPTIEEFESANKLGIRVIIPNMAGTFWTSTLVPSEYTGYAWAFDGMFGKSFRSIASTEAKVRCVLKR